MSEKPKLIYVLFQFTDSKELGIGSFESLLKPQLTGEHHEKISKIQELVAEKSKVAVSWPVNQTGWSLVKKNNCEYKWRPAVIINFSDDKDVIIQTRDNNRLEKSYRQPTKGLTGITDSEMEGLVTGGIFSEEDSSDAESNGSLGDFFERSPAAKENRSQTVMYGNRDVLNKSAEDLNNSKITSPAHPSYTQLVNVTVQKSKTGPSVSSNGSASKRRKIQQQQEHDRLAKEMAKLQESMGHRTDDENDEQNEVAMVALQEEIKSLKLEILKIEANFENERQQFDSVLSEKEMTIIHLKEEILSLKSSDPFQLVSRLNDGLDKLKWLCEGLTASASTARLEGTTVPSTCPKVKLDASCETLIDKNALKNAMSYGKVGSTVSSLNAMVNVLMEAIWDRPFMASHSLTGRRAPTDKSNRPAKPKLPADPVMAIQSFAVQFWKKHHKIDLLPSMVSHSITSKLLTEHSSFQKREQIAFNLGFQEAAC